MNTRNIIIFSAVCAVISAWAGERQQLWPSIEKMPYYQEHQIAAMTDETWKPGGKWGEKNPDFKPEEHRIPYIEWYDKPAETNANGAVMILISGGSYQCQCDVGLVKFWNAKLTALGYQCVNFVHRTPRPHGINYALTAFVDGQRAVRFVRSQAEARGFDPERIGVIGMSAGGHLTTHLATSALTRSYEPIDDLDKNVPCHINIAVANAPAYNTQNAGGNVGCARPQDGTTILDGLRPDPILAFDEKTCPISFHHGANDGYTPNGSTQCYRELHKRGIPAELHLYADKGHGAHGFDRAVEFLHQMNFDRRLGDEKGRLVYTGNYTAETVKTNLWPEGKMPQFFPAHTNAPFLTWYVPKKLKTKAIQVVFPGGAYVGCNISGEGLPIAEYLNAKGMTVVVVKYRTPRPPAGTPKHWSAWQDAQRAMRLVRSEAPSRGLDPDRIGVMGFSAGGHLTLMAALSSTYQSYEPVDDVDTNVTCKANWAIPVYPAYVLTDGANGPNKDKGIPDEEKPVEEFLFDENSPPMCFLHGDADGYSSMGSVKVWERLRSMGIQSDLHTFAKRGHCFYFKAADGTGSATWLDRVWDFYSAKGFNR